MENIAYTNAERAAVNNGFSALQHACDTWDWTASPTIRAALKAAREGGQRPLIEAKALVVGAFLRGLTCGAQITAHELYGLASAYRDSLIVGAGYANRRDETVSFTPALIAASAAHDAALQRFLDRA